MNKKIIKTGAVVFVAAAIILAVFAGKGTYTDTMMLDGDAIESINMNMQDWTVKVEKSDTDEFYMEIMGKSEEQIKKSISVSQQGNELAVAQAKQVRDFVSNFSFQKENTIYIYIPENKPMDINIVSGSGDIYLSETANSKITIDTQSGEVVASGIYETCSLDIKTHSSDVDITFRSEPEDMEITAVTQKQETNCYLKNMQTVSSTQKEYSGFGGNRKYTVRIESVSGYITIV